MSYRCCCIVLLVLVGLGDATNTPFGRGNIRQTLNCVDRRGLPQPYEVIPPQPTRPGQVWLPAEGSFNVPRGRPDFLNLLTFLGDECSAASSVTERSGVPLPDDILAGTEPPIMADDVLNDFILTNPNDTSVLLQWIDANNFGICELMGNWTDLGPNYYPRYLLTTYCAANSCSLPQGQTCNPAFLSADVVVLRWDSCTISRFSMRETLGWKKVRIQRIHQCECSCESNI